MAACALAATSVAQPAPGAPARIFRIGILNEATPATLRPEIVRWMARQGFEEGRHVTYEFMSSMGNPALLEGLARKLVATSPDALMAPSPRAALALRDATTTIPIVTTSADPVGIGLVSNLARPGGNVTGVVVPLIDLAGKRIQLLKELIPELAQVTLLWNPSAVTAREQMESAREAARGVGIRTTVLEVSSDADLERAFRDLAAERPQALLMMQDPFLLNASERIAAFVIEHGIPASHPYRRFVDAGGLISYGITADSIQERTTGYVARILRGAKPGDLPFMQPDRFDLFINGAAANRLRITIPRSVLVRATEIVR